MRSIVSYSPFSELRRLADQMDRLWESDTSPLAGFGGDFSVPIDIWEENNNLFVKAALPGVNPDDININIDNGILTMSGEFKDENENQNPDRRMYHREFRYGSFNRSVRLPEGANEDQIDAEYNNGFLTVRVPRAEEQARQPKRIPVKTGEQRQLTSEERKERAA